MQCLLVRYRKVFWYSTARTRGRSNQFGPRTYTPGLGTIGPTTASHMLTAWALAAQLAAARQWIKMFMESTVQSLHAHFVGWLETQHIPTTWLDLSTVLRTGIRAGMQRVHAGTVLVCQASGVLGCQSMQRTCRLLRPREPEINVTPCAQRTPASTANCLACHSTTPHQHGAAIAPRSVPFDDCCQLVVVRVWDDHITNPKLLEYTSTGVCKV